MDNSQIANHKSQLVKTGESKSQYRASIPSVSVQYRRETGKRQERDRSEIGKDRREIGAR